MSPNNYLKFKDLKDISPNSDGILMSHVASIFCHNLKKVKAILD